MMIFAMLHNTATNRYHPIVFRMAPMHGDADRTMDVWRYKSVLHHPVGFDTREQAVANMKETCRKEPLLAISDREFEWDGKDMPAMVEWFPNPTKMPANG